MVFSDRHPKKVEKISPEELERLEKEAIGSAGGIKAFNESRERFRIDNEFLEEHIEEWGNLYPDKWAAVYRKELIGPADDYFELLQMLTKRDILPPDRPVIAHLSTERIKWILLKREASGVS